ncbi:MAG: AAA-associated domain-containing protein [Alphaproteobacteria bacterium]
MLDTLPPVTTDVLEARGVRQAFPKPAGGELVVLDDVSLALREGEIVGLLGRSGCGKSTLLRIIAGLIRPSAGEVRYEGKPLQGPAEGIAMVFQTFALFPWLSVLENAEIGLEARGMPEAVTRRRALQAIDLIGLDGYESAYPRELSGGMRQRVGFARALVVEPKVLLMDEPFSALDVLTAETLRTDFLDLWIEKRMPMKAVLLVTHNIEEAVFMCDRILILSSSPGRITGEIRVPFAHPRGRLDSAFRQMVDDIYGRMTARPAPAPGTAVKTPVLGVFDKLPRVSINRLSGLMETVAAAPYNGRADLPAIAATLQLEVDDLFPIAEALQLMGFAELAQGDIQLTTAGRLFVESDTQARKRIFAEHLMRSIPLAAHVRRVLDERPGHRAPRLRFETEIEDHLPEGDAQETLRAVISWGRYAELFSYDDEAEMFSLENPAA